MVEVRHLIKEILCLNLTLPLKRWESEVWMEKYLTFLGELLPLGDSPMMLFKDLV